MDINLSLFYVPPIIRTYLLRSTTTLCSNLYPSSLSVLSPRDFPIKNFAWTHFLFHPSHMSSPLDHLMVLWSQFPSLITRTMLWLCPLHILLDFAWHTLQFQAQHVAKDTNDHHISLSVTLDWNCICIQFLCYIRVHNAMPHTKILRLLLIFDHCSTYLIIE
jgi:hypothetical protein